MIILNNFLYIITEYDIFNEDNENKKTSELIVYDNSILRLNRHILKPGQVLFEIFLIFDMKYFYAKLLTSLFFLVVLLFFIFSCSQRYNDIKLGE
jgi:hypothetical protein